MHLHQQMDVFLTNNCFINLDFGSSQLKFIYVTNKRHVKQPLCFRKEDFKVQGHKLFSVAIAVTAPVVGFVSTFIAIICIHIKAEDVTVWLVTTKRLLAEFTWVRAQAVHSPTWLIHCVLWQQVGFSSGHKWLCLSCASYGGAHICACFSWDQDRA